ncbi:MAG: cbb3-type cytochrome oxidase subunit 3 [Myxococcota bacterium]|jgi:cbb3-type cytochrome oxidase subunit 3
MNPLFQAAKQSITDDTGLLMGVVTLLFMALYAAWGWYAYAPSRAAAMEAYGQLPFDDPGDP